MMLILRVLMIFTCCIVADVHFVLYHSNNHRALSPFFDCLYASWIDDGSTGNAPYIHNYYLIPYCRRPDDGEKEEESAYISFTNIAKKINFNQLKKNNVTSEQLISWSVPIDIAEQYEINNEDSEGVLYNCSPPWFGSKCQYKFDDDSPFVFSDIVRATFINRSDHSTNISTGTCYRFVNNCDRGPWPLCLDWREVCDGKVDCLNGDDEQMCDELEMNQCTDDEYRCHNGQCIPLVFAREGILHKDCLDGSDERELSFNNMYHPYTFNYDCFNIPTFRCEERTNRYIHHFSCGDGQYNPEPIIPTKFTYCNNNRDKEMNRMMLTSFNYIENIPCRQAFYCALHANRSFGYELYQGDITIALPIFEGEWNKDCEPLKDSCFSEWLLLPEKPIMFDFFQFVYLTNRSIDEFKINIQPDFVCFDEKKCPVISCEIVHLELPNELKCCHTSNLTLTNFRKNFNDLQESFSDIVKKCLKSGHELSCKNSSDFHCNISLKCISFHRVRDGFKDCLYGEDELFPTCFINDTNRFSCKNELNKCLSPVAIGNGYDDCLDGNDERINSKQDFNEIKSYSTICYDLAAQYYVHLLYDDNNGLDCELWPCDNPYVHCDTIWDCPNGIDELNCPNTTCSFNEHLCKNNNLKLSYCLPITQIVDKYIPGCINDGIKRILYFINDSNIDDDEYYSWNQTKCITADKICRLSLISSSIVQKEEEEVCLYERQLPELFPGHSIYYNQTELCQLELEYVPDRKESFLTSFRFGNFPLKSSSMISVRNIPIKELIFPKNISQTWFCHRGILILYGINQIKKCLCPPSYFGSQCQWQSQRISLTIEFISPRTVFITFAFQIIIMLINEQGEIMSNYEKISFIPARDCGTKFNLYLLYPNRPKYNSNKYSIRIDIFDKITTLKFWASWHLTIPFQFLPVNRISTQVFIPKIREIESSCSLVCGNHGRCIRYTNKKSLFYCRCDQGYSGLFCNITYSCSCSQDSLCLSSTICVCPLEKYGSYCYLKRSINNSCQHNGLYMPNDDRINSQSFTCFCKEGYFGLNCEYSSNRIELIFDDKIILTISFVFIHFITTFEDVEHQRTTLLKKIPLDKNSIILYRSQPFNILFVQLPNQTYYLIILREIFIPMENIQNKILLKQQCLNISNLLNSTIFNYTQMARAKFYPLVCRKNSQLMCFYDETLMCICDINRFANCFQFNHTINNDCQGYNDCENDGQCFLNNQTCPTMSICMCKDCFHGNKCQFPTTNYLISLDAILGYHIKPNMTLNEQSAIVKASMTIIIIFFIWSLIHGVLSILTFRTKKSKEVGCGYYLLTSSIISILMICVLVIKFMHLLLSQMEIITNRSILFINCLLIDVLLKILLASNEWMIACVAIERLYSVTKGVNFNKEKSRKMAKWIILTVFLLTILSHIHDPIYRHLIDDIDGDQLRIWCFVRYSSSINIYNSSITLIHFLGPFSIHLISAFVIIKSVIRSRSNAQQEQSIKQQLYRHKHLFYTPAMLIFFGLPRLIITFSTGCMRTLHHPWLYLIGYFISFLPSILIFITFVLPSENYRKEFQMAIQQQLRRFRTY